MKVMRLGPPVWRLGLMTSFFDFSKFRGCLKMLVDAEPEDL